MRYSKKHVNEILDQLIEAVMERYAEDDIDPELDDALQMIKEEHMLIDRRKSSLPEYRSDILRDFMVLKLSYKELMGKYHCSERTVKGLLMECAVDDERIAAEMEFRRH